MTLQCPKGSTTVQLRCLGPRMRLFYRDVEDWIACKAGDRVFATPPRADLAADERAPGPLEA